MKQTLARPSWTDIEKGVSNIIHQMRFDITIEVIVGLTRGGLIPAVIASHILADTEVIPVQYSSSEGRGDDKQECDDLPYIIDVPILIIDDICDSGHTMKEVYEFYNKAGLIYPPITAALYYKEGSAHRPDYVWQTIPEDAPWIIFPWEQG